MIFLIDYDGTCVPALQEVGFSNIDTGAERVLKRLVENGHKLVLWTARNDSPDNPWNWMNGKMRPETSLQEAVRWFKERNIPLTGINEVPGEKSLVGNSRKALGDYIIDDTCVCIKKKYATIRYFSLQKKQYFQTYTFWVDWDYIEKVLVQENLL